MKLHPVSTLPKKISEVLLSFLQAEFEGYYNAIVIEFDDFTMKNKVVLRPGILSIRFDDKSFFSTVLGFTPSWNYKHYNQYISQKNVNLISANKIHLECDVIDGSVVNAMRQPVIYSFILDKTPGYEIPSEIETIHYKKNK